MIFNIIGKNLKIIFRSPFTIFLLILAPIILMFIVGFTYSGEALQDTTIGLIDTQSDFFKFNEIEFVNFVSNGNSEGLNDCIKELKKSELELCICFKPQYDKNDNLISGQIIYYIDNTRPQISDILVGVFNSYIDKKTKEISSKTVTDIFSEIDKTVIFMQDNQELISNIKEDINTTKVNIESFQKYLNKANEDYDIIYREIKASQVIFNNNFNMINKDAIELKNNLDDLLDDIYNLNNNIDDIEDDIDDIIDAINFFASIEPSIYSYISVNDLEYIKNTLQSLEYETATISVNIQNVQNALDKINDISIMQTEMNKIVEEIEQVKIYLLTANQQVEDVLDIIEERENKLNQVEDEINNKIDYFNSFSNKDAKEITEPISKVNELLFNNFKRIHQLSPVVVILILLFIGLLLSNVIVSLEINSKAYFRNLISPVKQTKFIFGLFCTSLLIILFQLVFLFGVLNLFFGINMFNSQSSNLANFIHLFNILLIVIHLLIVFILLGIFLAYRFSSIQVSILVTTFVMLFMFLLSDIIVPLEIMPSLFSKFLAYNPVIIGENLLRKMFFFSSFHLTIKDILIFYPYIVCLILGVLLVSKKREKELF